MQYVISTYMKHLGVKVKEPRGLEHKRPRINFLPKIKVRFRNRHEENSVCKYLLWFDFVWKIDSFSQYMLFLLSSRRPSSLRRMVRRRWRSPGFPASWSRLAASAGWIPPQVASEDTHRLRSDCWRIWFKSVSFWNLFFGLTVHTFCSKAPNKFWLCSDWVTLLIYLYRLLQHRHWNRDVIQHCMYYMMSYQCNRQQHLL